jgi:hypothetical protein
MEEEGVGPRWRKRQFHIHAVTGIGKLEHLPHAQRRLNRFRCRGAHLDIGELL